MGLLLLVIAAVIPGAGYLASLWLHP